MKESADGGLSDLRIERVTGLQRPVAGLDLRHLRAFLAVAEELHFTRAAKRLHIAQQALSSQIQQIEKALGTPLFVRTTRSVTLTDAGHTLRGHAGSILAAVDSAWEQTWRAGNGELGAVTVAYTPTVAHEALPKMTDELHRRYPSIRLQTYETWQADALAAVSSGRLEVGFVRCFGPFDSLDWRVLRREPLGIVLAEDHPLAGRPETPISALRNETLTIWPRDLSPDYFDLVTGFFRANGFAGDVWEFENLSRAVFFGDIAAREKVESGSAFSVALATEPLPSGFVWNSVDPAPRVPLTIFWRKVADTVVANFVEVATAVATAQGWLEGDPAPTDD